MNVTEFLATLTPKFKDFVALKVGGWDEYSELGYAALRRRMTEGDIAQTEVALQLHANRARVYRWVLRGLPLEYAIRKVETDLEVSAKARRARGEEEWWDDERMAGPVEIEIAGFDLIRVHANKVIVTKDGEIVAEKEVNGDTHFDRFVAKFRTNRLYRDSLLSNKEGRQ